MKKIYVQVIDNFTGIYQTGMIQEPVSKGKEIENAVAHFGVSYGLVVWDIKRDIDFNQDNVYGMMTGRVDGTTKVVSVVYY